MFRSCKCKTLHKLASKVTEYLPNQSAVAIANNMEFTGVRSSPAFRHTVLEKQGLNSADTHCFDLIEEALTAMVKGHMLRPRKQVTLKEIYAKVDSVPSNFSNERGGATSDDNDGLRIDMSSILAVPRAMSALRMLDVKAEYSPFSFDRYLSENEARYKKKEKEPSSQNLDWVTYVDELYEKNESVSA